MKKSILILAAIATVFTTTNVIAKKKKTTVAAKPKVELTDSKAINDVMVFDADAFNFGTLEEGAPAEHVFTFVNHSKTPLVIQNARASCGCTTPSWSKEPIKPGGTGTITAKYSTKNRPGDFNKTVTVTTNFGNKVLKISGRVNPKPKTSTPTTKTLIKQ